MAFTPVSIYVKLLKSIKIFESYDHKCTAMFLRTTVYLHVLASEIQNGQLVNLSATVDRVLI